MYVLNDFDFIKKKECYKTATLSNISVLNPAPHYVFSFVYVLKLTGADTLPQN